MWAKVLAGVVAAAAVVTLGVYIATPPTHCDEYKPGVRSRSGGIGDDCCTVDTCPIDTQAFAACAGGLVAVQPEPTTASKSCPVGACCGE